MNVDTGEIKYFNENEPVPKNFRLIDPDEMTTIQRKNKKISLSDHKSTLGKKLTRARKNVKLSRKSRKEFNKDSK